MQTFSNLTRDFAKASSSYSLTVDQEQARTRRLALVAFVSISWVCLLVYRLHYLQIDTHGTWQDKAKKEHLVQFKIASERGAVYDRLGKPMALSVPAGSLYLRPNQVKNPADLIKTLGRSGLISEQEVKKAIKSTKPFVWLVRQIPLATAQKILASNVPGIGVIEESRRFYPYGTAAAPLIGKVNVDGQGLSGLEAKYEKLLHTDSIKTLAYRDAYGNPIETPSEVSSTLELPKGDSLQLTLDAEIQMIVDEELELGRQNANAKSATAVMVDAQTGEILAMSQAPAINLNSQIKAPARELRNLVLETVFEPGSILKPVIMAEAIEAGLNPNTQLDCEHGMFRFASHTIRDVHPYGVLSLHDIIVRSSNIGISKVGSYLGSERLYKSLQKFGFGAASGLGLAGETTGIFRPVSRWAKVDVATHSFGQGIAVTPLQIVRAVSALVNGGELPQLKLVKDKKGFDFKKILSNRSADLVKQMLVSVVEDQHGTGGKAKIEGITIGGKTGTAQKAGPNGGYQPGAYVASFVGFADLKNLGTDQTLTLLVSIDEPDTNTIYGGSLAGPVFKTIMERVLNLKATRHGLKTEDKNYGNQADRILEPVAPKLPLQTVSFIK